MYEKVKFEIFNKNFSFIKLNPVSIAAEVLYIHISPILKNRDFFVSPQ